MWEDSLRAVNTFVAASVYFKLFYYYNGRNHITHAPSARVKIYLKTHKTTGTFMFGYCEIITISHEFTSVSMRNATRLSA